MTILHVLQSALSSELRPAALRSLAGMSDTSDDESSPNHAAINAPTSLAQASRAVHFTASMQSAGSSTGFSTNGDMVHNALMRGIDRRAADNARAAAGDDASDSSHVETASEVRLRYLNADESEVSDPERWLLLNYGEETEEEEENLEG